MMWYNIRCVNSVTARLVKSVWCTSNVTVGDGRRNLSGGSARSLTDVVIWCGVVMYHAT